MVSLRTFVVSALVAVATAKSAVINLAPSNFDDVVLKSGKPTLVKFFAPWCGHCKTLAPVYEELASGYEHANDKVQIAKVDADAERALGKRFGIQGFPTLKWFDGVSDTPHDYNGARSLEDLAGFVEQKSSVKIRKKWAAPSSVQILTDVSFVEQVGGDQGVLVAFTAPWCTHCKSLAPEWEKAAETYKRDKSVVIAKVDCEAPNSKSLTQKQGITSYPTIKWFPPGSTVGEDYKGARNEQGVVEFINEKAGLHRTVGGSLDHVAGTLAALDSLVVKLTGGSTVSDVLTQAKAESSKLSADVQKKSAEYYLRVLTKMGENHEYAKKELTRLQGMLSKGGLAEEKRDELTIKTNILKKFEDIKIAAGEAAEKVVQKVTEAKDAASKKAGEAADAASKKAGEAKDAASKKAGEAADAASKKAGEAADAAAETVEEIKSAAGEKAKAAKDAAEKKAADIKEEL
ncbi:hypothetical protein BROUX41_000794 [Berkeleyomyces rouxiae]|uniref:uncharacterized protein n=1 Tax=Berkeleyomyces rouxiae TaxID=2035830 RepID=UPI003B75E596